jgi:hypothetical protein
MARHEGHIRGGGESSKGDSEGGVSAKYFGDASVSRAAGRRGYMNRSLCVP